MAKLHNLQTQQTIELMPQHSFGRHASCNTLLTNPKASRHHATISWDGVSWILQDNSSNGCFINAERTQPGQEKIINLDDQIQFGPDDHIWQVQDLVPAKSLLMPLSSGAAMIELEQMIVLPNEDRPKLTLYKNNNDQWICESEAGTSTLISGSTVAVDDKSWRFIAAQVCAKTLAEQQQQQDVHHNTQLFFKVSQDEEHVFINIKVDNEYYDLGERHHHYLLLLLVRQRQQDKQTGYAADEQGWISRDQLATMLGIDEIHINVLIYRLRKQFIKQLPQGTQLPQMIEKRRGSIRFVFDNIDISGGLSL